MNIARVIGRVVCTVRQDTLDAITLQWIQPLNCSGATVGKPLVAVDRIGTGPGEVIVYITSREARSMSRSETAGVIDQMLPRCQ